MVIGKKCLEFFNKIFESNFVFFTKQYLKQLESAAEILVDFSKTYYHFLLEPENVEASCDFMYNQTLCPY